jgi:hypothetical protein
LKGHNDTIHGLNASALSVGHIVFVMPPNYLIGQVKIGQTMDGTDLCLKWIIKMHNRESTPYEGNAYRVNALASAVLVTERNCDALRNKIVSFLRIDGNVDMKNTVRYTSIDQSAIAKLIMLSILRSVAIICLNTGPKLRVVRIYGLTTCFGDVGYKYRLM